MGFNSGFKGLTRLLTRVDVRVWLTCH